MKIYKYELCTFVGLPPGDVITIKMPPPYVVKVGVQGPKICLWAEVNPEEAESEYHYKFVPTGAKITSNMRHVETFFDGPFVWHLYKL